VSHVESSALLQRCLITPRQQIGITIKLPEHSYLFLNCDILSYIGINYYYYSLVVVLGITISVLVSRTGTFNAVHLLYNIKPFNVHDKRVSQTSKCLTSLYT